MDQRRPELQSFDFGDRSPSRAASGLPVRDIGEYEDLESIKARTYDKSLLELRQVFALFDQDGNGTITKDELEKCLASLDIRPTPAELDYLHISMDKDGDGTISFEEFVRVMSDEREEAELEQELHDMQNFFVMMDKDGSGRLSVDELQRAIKAMGAKMNEAECRYLYSQMSTDGSEDGVSFEEFATFLLKYDYDGV